MRKVLTYWMLFAVVMLPSVGVCADEVVEEIIARVNNQIITRTEYLRSRDQIKQEAMQQDPVNGDKIFAQREKDVLRDLIDQQLLLDRGKDMDITGDTEVIKRLDEMRKQMNLDSMEALEKAAQAQGVSFEDFKQNLKNQIITQQVISREVGSRMALTKEEEQKYYDDHKAELTQPEQIRLSELLVATPDMNDAQKVAAAKTKAEGLLAEIRKGASFDDVAKKNSEGPTAEQGGDLGYFKRGVLAKELEEKTFAMKAGEVSDVIQTRQGFVILKVTEHHEAGIPPFKDIEPRIQDAIYMERLQPALRAFLTKLREEAFIDIKPGYVDSAASPNETKPVETASKDASAKTLKKKKKFLIF
jgi:peptidyl-prolyl cis-trans isomerase SurA